MSKYIYDDKDRRARISAGIAARLLRRIRFEDEGDVSGPINPEWIGVERPKTRADCANIPRPCPFVSCRHHLMLEVRPGFDRNGIKVSASVKLNYGLDEFEERESCSLDVADRDDNVTLERISVMLDITRERVRQIEERALKKLGVSRYIRQAVAEEARYGTLKVTARKPQQVTHSTGDASRTTGKATVTTTNEARATDASSTASDPVLHTGDSRVPLVIPTRKGGLDDWFGVPTHSAHGLGVWSGVSGLSMDTREGVEVETTLSSDPDPLALPLSQTRTTEQAPKNTCQDNSYNILKDKD